MALPDGLDSASANSWEAFLEKTKEEMGEVGRELREIDRMLEQSKIEVEKLAQRNSTITMHLQQVQTQMESIPVNDVRTAYDAALEAQQRLIVMRGQVEKLESEKNQLQKYSQVLQELHQIVSDDSEAGMKNGKGGTASAEMLIQAQEAERQRLSRQMHDGPAQALSNFILLTEIAMRLFDVDPGKAREELSNLKVAASNTFEKVRDFSFDLRPMMLDDLGLVPTVRRYVDAFREKTRLDVSVNFTGTERRLESYIEVMVFRAIQELLANAAKHSQASQVKIQLDTSEEEVRASVEDNGRGFDPQSLTEESGLGIKLIRERVEMMGGVFEIDSAVGQGARITFNIPAENASSFA